MGILLLTRGTLALTRGTFARLWIAAAALCLALQSQAWAREIVVVAGPGFPVESLTREDVRDIFLGEKAILSGLRLRPMDLKDAGKVRLSFLKTFLKVSEDGYQAYWIRKVFQDGGTPPTALSSLEAAVQLLQADNAAVGFLWTEDAVKAASLRILLKIQAME